MRKIILNPVEDSISIDEVRNTNGILCKSLSGGYVLVASVHASTALRIVWWDGSAGTHHKDLKELIEQSVSISFYVV